MEELNDINEIGIATESVYVYEFPNTGFALYSTGDSYGVFESELAVTDSDRWIVKEKDYYYFDEENELELEGFVLTKEHFEQAQEQLVTMVEALIMEDEL